MKLVCSSRSFRRGFDGRLLDLVALVDLAADIGLDGIEAQGGAFPSVSKKFQRELRERLDRRLIALSAISLASDFASSDAAERVRQADDLVAWTEIARELGVRTLCVLAGRLPSDVPADEGRRRVTECFAGVLPAAERAGVTLALGEEDGENSAGPLNSTKGTVPVFSPDELSALVMRFGSANFQLCLDANGFESPGAARHAVYFRLRFSDIDADGRPAGADVPRLFDLCRRACYDGYLSLEYVGEGNEEEAVRKAAGYLRPFILR